MFFFFSKNFLDKLMRLMILLWIFQQENCYYVQNNITFSLMHKTQSHKIHFNIKIFSCYIFYRNQLDISISISFNRTNLNECSCSYLPFQSNQLHCAIIIQFHWNILMDNGYWNSVVIITLLHLKKTHALKYNVYSSNPFAYCNIPNFLWLIESNFLFLFVPCLFNTTALHANEMSYRSLLDSNFELLCQRTLVKTNQTLANLLPFIKIL